MIVSLRLPTASHAGHTSLSKQPRLLGKTPKPDNLSIARPSQYFTCAVIYLIESKPYSYNKANQSRLRWRCGIRLIVTNICTHSINHMTENTPTFADLGICPEILEAIDVMGFDTPSAIQAKAIPIAINGSDIVGQSHTGSGKTLAFVIPALEAIDANDKCPQILALTPTRELAQQVCREVEKLSMFLDGISAVSIYGGASFKPQLDAFRRGVQFVVGTPGRIIDHIESGALDVSKLRMLILDEADEMLDMGFIEDIERITKALPKERQTLFFSATMSPQIKSLMQSLTNNAQKISIERPTLTVPTIEQIYHELLPSSRIEVLSRLLDTGKIKLGIVFCNTKRVVDDVVDGLVARGHAVDRLHGDMPQTLRERVMDSYRKGSLKILVATDVAARGIDVNNIDTVVNFELPRDPEDYVHRIGRTARAGKSGRAISFVGRRDFSLLSRIERFIGTKLICTPVITGEQVEQMKREALVDELIEKLSSKLPKSEPVAISEDDENAVIDTTVEGEEQAEVAAADLSSIEIELPECLNDIEAKPEAIIATLFEMLCQQGSHPAQPIPEDRGGRNDRPDSKSKRANGALTEVASLFINAGKSLGIQPKDIAGLLYNEANIPKGGVGDIRIFAKHSIVEISPEYVESTLASCQTCSLCGFEVNFRLDDPNKRPSGGGFGGERRGGGGYGGERRGGGGFGGERRGGGGFGGERRGGSDSYGERRGGGGFGGERRGGSSFGGERDARKSRPSEAYKPKSQDGGKDSFWKKPFGK